MSQAQLTQTTIVVSTSSHYSKRSMLSNFSRRHPRLHQVPESIVEQAPQEEGTILETRMANAHSYECGRSNPLLDFRRDWLLGCLYLRRWSGAFEILYLALIWEAKNGGLSITQCLHCRDFGYLAPQDTVHRTMEMYCIVSLTRCHVIASSPKESTRLAALAMGCHH
jgi:hypothetical protein